MKTNNKNRGMMLVNVLVFSAIAIVIVTAFLTWVSVSVKIAKTTYYKAEALEIAEAGVDYYRWHLAHSPSDFQDGTGSTGPYVHNFYDQYSKKF